MLSIVPFLRRDTRTLTSETFWQAMMLEHPFIHAAPSRGRRQRLPSPCAPTEEGGGGAAKSATPLHDSSSSLETMEQSRPATSAQGMQGRQGRGGATSTGTRPKNLLEWKLSRRRPPQTCAVFWRLSSINHVHTSTLNPKP